MSDQPHDPATRYVAEQVLGEQDGVTRSAGRDTLLDRPVHIQVARGEAASALARDARLLARLAEANAPAVLDVVHDAEATRLITRPVEGTTLAEAIRSAGAGLPPAGLANVGATLQTLLLVAEAVARGHRLGVAHRRLDPASVVLGGDGGVTILGWEKASRGNSGTARLTKGAPVLDQAADDVRGLGGLLAQALLLRPLADAGDPIGTISATELARFPAGVEAIVRAALGSPAGYGDVAALAADLRAAAAAHAREQWRPGMGERWSLWLRRRTAGLALAALVVLAAGLAWYAIAAQRQGAWLQPVAETRFAKGTWEADWQMHSPGVFVQTPDGLRSETPGPALLIHRKRLTLPIAIEYEGEIASGTQPGDLSVIWSERDDGLKDTFSFLEAKERNVRFQAGCFDNTHCGIYDLPADRLLARHPLRLQAGHRYAMRVEIHPDHASMTIDGQEVLRSTFDFPLTSGYVALYGYHPGKTFRHVAISAARTPEAISPLAIGDALMQLRRYADAANAYGRIVETHHATVLADQARFGKGLAERLDNRAAMSQRSWSEIREPVLARRCRILELDDLVAGGDYAAAGERFRALWPTAGEAERSLLVQRWSTWSAALLAKPEEPGLRPPLGGLVELRTALFPEDDPSGETAGSALNRLGRFTEVVERSYRFERSYTNAMIALGRANELVDSEHINCFGRLYARWVTGSLAKIVADPFTPVTSRAFALCRLGRAAEAVELTPSGHPALLFLGRAQQQLDQRPLSAEAATAALIATGRLDLAAGAGVADVPDSGGSATALWLLGRDDEAEARAGVPNQGMRLVAALERGADPAPVLEAMRLEHLPLDLRKVHGATWFSWCILRHYAQHPDRAAWQAAMREEAKANRWVAAQRPYLIATCLAGDAAPASLQGLPYASEVEAWTAVSEGLLADLAGDAAAALAAYRRFTALPAHLRMLDECLPNPEVERFVAWRLRTLAR